MIWELLIEDRFPKARIAAALRASREKRLRARAVVIGDGNRAPMTERYVAESATILDESELCLGAAIHIVEHRLGKPASRQSA